MEVEVHVIQVPAGMSARDAWEELSTLGEFTVNHADPDAEVAVVIATTDRDFLGLVDDEVATERGFLEGAAEGT